MKEGPIQLNLSKPDKKTLFEPGKFEAAKLSVRIATSEDWQSVREIRIEAKLKAPDNIGGKLEDDLDKTTEDDWERELNNSD